MTCRIFKIPRPRSVKIFIRSKIRRLSNSPFSRALLLTPILRHYAAAHTLMKLSSLSVAVLTSLGLVEAGIPGTATVTSYGTHKYGRFDKTSRTKHVESSGTHKYGKFDNTRQRTTTTHIKHSPNAAVPGASNFGGAKQMGLIGAGAAAGALMLL